MSIYKRGETYWIQYFRNGERLRESTGSDDEKVAKKLLKKRNAETTTGQYVGAGVEKICMEGLFQMVIADYKRLEKNDYYIVTKRTAKHLSPFFGQMRVADFGTDKLNAYIDKRKAEGAANATINRELAILRRGFTLGLEAKPPKVASAPVIKDLPEDNVRHGFVTDEVYEAILSHLPLYAGVALVIGYHTGIRRGEILSLTWDMVDMEQSFITIPKTHTKSKAAHVIPIYDDMIPWLQKAKDNQSEDCPYVVQYQGRGLTRFGGAWAAAITAAGVPGVLFHDLRRCAVRQMERNGVARTVAMSITGHKTETMYRRYAIVSPEDLKDAVRKMSKRPKEDGTGGS